MFLYGWGWLRGLSILHPPQRFTVQFHDVAGLNNNAPVNVNGVRVGTVEKLSLKKKGQVLVQLKINTEDVTIPRGSTFTIQTLGLVGAKYMEISLPDEKPGETLPPLDQNSEVVGQDPVRVELVANKVATNLAHIDFAGVEGTLSKNMERMAKAADSVQEAAQKFGGVADEARGATSNANHFFERGARSFDKVDAVASGSRNSLDHFNAFADDWRTTSHKLNKVLDNPALTADLRDTMEKARQTVEVVQGTIKDLTKTASDPTLRQDMNTWLERLNTSSSNIYKSVQIVKDVSGDQALRSDLKGILSQARETMDKADTILSQPAFGSDLRSTLIRVRKASEDVDTVARQLHQVLDQKRPLVKMLFGRPGYMKETEIVPVNEPAPKRDGSGEQLADPNKIEPSLK